MFTKVLYGGAILWLLVSWCKSREKTQTALKKAWKSFENILPSVLAVLVLIGLILTLLNPKTISKLLGAESGVLGLCIAAGIGSVTLMPGFVALPLSASLVQAGAGHGQIAAFISTLMMVGVATFPLEASYFGKRTAWKRNLLSFAVAVASALVIGGILK